MSKTKVYKFDYFDEGARVFFQWDCASESAEEAEKLAWEKSKEVGAYAVQYRDGSSMSSIARKLCGGRF